MSPAMAQFRDGPAVPHGPDVAARAYDAWAEQHRADLVYHCEEDIDLNVYALHEDGLVSFIQGGDEIAIPLEDFSLFVAALADLHIDGAAL